MVRRDGSAPSASSVSVRRSTIDLPARWCRTPDLHRDCSRSERDASAVGLVRRMWLPRIDSHDDDLGQSQAGCCYLTGQ